VNASKMTAIEAADLIGRKVLITCDNYFFAPDGRQYRAVFGTLAAVQTSEESLGIKVSVRSQDWYMTVGNMKIASCQIHYAILTESCNFERAPDYQISPEKGLLEFNRPSGIYRADPPEAAA
jgi:hypothetical protein